MKKRLLSIPILSIAFISLTAFVKIFSSGIAGVTGSPGETNCANCHAGGGGVTSVSVIAAPAFTGNQYIAGQTYTINIFIVNPSFSLFGFDCEILTLTNANAGTMANAFPGVQFMNSGARKNATHTGPKSGTGSAAFSFEWTAPTSGTAKIYVAGNAIDGTGGTGGDKPGSTVITLIQNVTGVKEQITNVQNFNIYPNPVISDFRMQYSLSQGGNLKAALFDIRGQELSVLMNEDQSAGTHSVRAELPADLQAGIYMVKLSLNGAPCGQRMLVKQ